MRARFVEHRRTGDRALRNELVEEHRWMAEVVARRFTNRGEPFDDLLQVALLGLVKAVERFDPDVGTAFASFAMPTMFGELRRHFRDTTWSVHVPRRAKELHLEMAGVVQRLTAELGRSPLPIEVAESMKVTVEDVIQATEAGNAYRSSSTDATSGDRAAWGYDGPRMPIDEGGFAAADLGFTVATALGQLAPRERRIVELRFFEGWTQQEIAAEIGLSQVHVSRLLRISLVNMQAVLRELVVV